MTPNGRICFALFSAVAASILGAATALTLAIGAGLSEKWRLLFRVMCHGMERRCLEIASVPMPICARCTGIYIGMLAALAAFAVIPFLRRQLLDSRLAIALILPLALDGVTQALGLRESTNELRMVTGLAAGAAILWVMTRIELHRGAAATAQS